MSKPTITYTHSGDLFVIGGRDQAGKVSGDCFKLNGSKLVKIQSMARPRVSSGIFVGTDGIYMVGGCDEKFNPLPHVEKLSLTSSGGEDQWTTLPELREPCYSCSATVLNSETLVAVGGIGEGKQSLVSIQTLSLGKRKSQWVKVKAVLPRPLCNAGLYQTRSNEMVIFGGWDQRPIKDVYNFVEKAGNIRVTQQQCEMEFPDIFLINWSQIANTEVFIPGQERVHKLKTETMEFNV